MGWPRWARGRNLLRTLVAEGDERVWFYSYDRRIARRLARRTGVRFRVVVNDGLRSYDASTQEPPR